MISSNWRDGTLYSWKTVKKKNHIPWLRRNKLKTWSGSEFIAELQDYLMFQLSETEEKGGKNPVTIQSNNKEKAEHREIQMWER